MQEAVVSRLKAVKLGEPQTYENVAVFPITDGQGDAVSYITLSEALENRFLVVTEVSEGGSVPELKVANNAGTAVLILDGEELAGAKQNRVLNTTVLISGNQSIVIPVSCTEQGRWAYDGDVFCDSGTVMARGIRARKSRSVSESLAARASFSSNQGEVWNGIEDLHFAAGVAPRTCAMRDVFESRKESLDEALMAFPLVEGQVGMVAVINGASAGFDVVSRPAAYARLHGKLVKSYVMDALVMRKKKSVVAGAASKTARAFLDRALLCEEKVFKSVGCGQDFRFKGDHITGSALLHEGAVIHSAFFQMDEAAPEGGRMSGFGRRRQYRTI